jgi:hypothetical protein
MLADPAANEYSFNGARLMWAGGVCDAVQVNTYRIDAQWLRVPASDIVLRAFFNRWADGPYDHLGVLKEPFSLAKGGYAILERATRSRERDARRFHVQFRRRGTGLAASSEVGGLGSNVLAARPEPKERGETG